jgi:hypothetical protein
MPRRGTQHNPRQDDDMRAEFEADERSNTPTRAHEWRDPEMDPAEPGKDIPLIPGADDTAPRSEVEIERELAEVRERREQMFPSRREPLSEESPQPAGYLPGQPGGEITELIEREARLVLERAERYRVEGRVPDNLLQEEQAAAYRVLRRIEEMRP